jgi:hypothetical protein
LNLSLKHIRLSSFILSSNTILGLSSINTNQTNCLHSDVLVSDWPMASAPRFVRPRAVDSRTPGVRRLMPTAAKGCSQSQQPPASGYGHGRSREEARAAQDTWGWGHSLVAKQDAMLCSLQRSLHWATGTEETGICSAREKDQRWRRGDRDMMD